MKGSAVVEDGYVYEEETHLTVFKTCIFYAGDGFTVYDSKGDLLFRVESYGPDARDKNELFLMDSSGRSILTVRRRRPSLHQRWEGFLGEKIDGQEPIFSVKRSSIIGRSSVTVEVYNSNPGEEYRIEGSFGQRCCTIFNALKESVGEIKRKVDASTNVMFGKDVFSLYLNPGFDAAFAMGLVIVLNQIDGDDYADDDGAEMDITVDVSHVSP